MTWVQPTQHPIQPYTFRTSHNRWVLEAPDVYWEAPIAPMDRDECVPIDETGYRLYAYNLDPTPSCGRQDTLGRCLLATWESLDLTENINGDSNAHPLKSGTCEWARGR